ncbi:MAG: cation-translocating P-type ATPase [Candidatus Sigynarchaeota archaeon]
MSTTTFYYAKSPGDIAKELETSLQHGLSSEEAKRRLEKYGPNELAEEKTVPPIVKFLLQFKDFLVILLLIAAVISFAFGDFVEGFVIVIIVILNGVLGFVQEHRAEESLKKLKELAGDDTLVIRDGNETRVDIKDIVVGDILVMWEGETIGADARIFEDSRLKVEEGILTGESVPVDKNSSIINEGKVMLAEQKNMAFMGTTTVKGRGKAIVVRTGMATEMGKIAKATIESAEQKTPLQERLEKLGKFLGILVIVIVFFVMIAEFLIHMDANIPEVIETSIALAVSAVPEGLAAAITLTLALGVQRMARKRAIVRKLPAVETLGSVQVICTDKTGTLTQNKMAVQRLWTPAKGMVEVTGIGYVPKGNFITVEDGKQLAIDDERDLLELLKAGFLASTATIQYSSKDNAWHCEGDPTEGALVVAAMKTSYKVTWDEQTDPKPNGEIFFDSERKRMTIVYTSRMPGSEGTMAFMKGSPESVLDTCDSVQIGDKIVALDQKMLQTILATNKSLADKAFRVLGMAKRKLPDTLEEYTVESTEKNMTFLGLAAMIDPPREEVADAIATAKHAGIRIIMITGDQKNTALAIAKALDLKPYEDAEYTCFTAAELEAMDDAQFKKVMKDLDVCARASPSIKARIVETLQKDYNQVVAMTGDGVNDAPALKKADIGIAMGITGTDVAKSAADMVLADDNFATIISAVEEGRQIYDNMKAFIRFMLSSNFDEIFVVFVATVVFGWNSPFTALGILWINLLTDGLPAMALAVDPGDPSIMKRKPRGKGASLLHEILLFAIVGGIIAFFATLLLYAAYYPVGIEPVLGGYPNPEFVTKLMHARTVALTASVLFELGVVFVTRVPDGKSVWRHSPINNKYLLLAVGLAFGLQLFIIYEVDAAGIFELVPLDWIDWLRIAGSVLVGIVALDIVRLVQARHLSAKQG